MQVARRGDGELNPVWEPLDASRRALEAQKHLAGEALVMAVYLCARLGKPLLVEGEPECDRTEIADAIAAATGAELIRLQCFEGLDARSAFRD